MPFHDSDSSGILDQPITLAKIIYVVKSIKNNKSIGLDSTVGEIHVIKYGGKPMCEILTLFNLVWNNEYVFTYWREGLLVSLFKKKLGEILVIIDV